MLPSTFVMKARNSSAQHKATLSRVNPDRSTRCSGIDHRRLRKDQGLRELVQERMQSVKVVLDTLVEDVPARQIVLRD